MKFCAVRVSMWNRERRRAKNPETLSLAGKILAELGEVVAGTRAGRETSEEITLYKSVGVAMEDIAAAELVYERACA